MQRTLTLVAMLAVAVHAQEPEADAAPRSADELLATQLRMAAQVGSANFEAMWRWPTLASRHGVRGTVAAIQMAGAGADDATHDQRAKGRIRGDLFTVRLDGSVNAEVLRAGRFTLSREDQKPWQLSGVAGYFIPDPQLLLLAFANMQLTVSDRSIGERDGRAVEQVAVTLTDEQVARLEHAEAMLRANPMSSQIERMLSTDRMDPAKVPLSVTEVAFEFDVATRQLTRLHLRVLGEPIDMRQLMMDASRWAGGIARATEGSERRQLPKPTAFAEGLPVRETEGMVECSFVLNLTGHGAADPIELDAVQRRLLGR